MDCKSKMPPPRTSPFVEAPTREAWEETCKKVPKDELWRLLAYAHNCLPTNPEWGARLNELFAYASENEVTLRPD
jgi:hypothetical protein